MPLRRMNAYVERQNGVSDGPLRVVAATEGRKADGLDLRMDRVRLDRWRSNPVVLLEHFPMTVNADMLASIGRADNIAVEGDALKTDVTFDTASRLGAEIDRQYRQRFMHAFSIGFDNGEVDSRGVPEWWEPVELSAVPIPLDSDALVEDGRDQVVTMARAVLGDADVAERLRAALMPDRTPEPEPEPEPAPEPDEGRQDDDTPRLRLAERRLRLVETEA